MSINTRKKQNGGFIKKVSVICVLTLFFQLVFNAVLFINFADAQDATVQNFCTADVDVVLVMDRSGSMNEEGADSLCQWENLEWVVNTNTCVYHQENNLTEEECLSKDDDMPQCPFGPVYTPEIPTKIDNAKIAAINFLENLTVNDQSSLVSFANDATLDQALTNIHSDTQLKISSLLADGATNIGDAILLANTELSSANSNPQAVKVIILLTDGKANQPSGNGIDENLADIQYAKDMALIAANAGYKIFTIGLGSDVNSTMLQSIADMTSGAYYPSPTSDQLSSIYEAISQKICEYGSISGCKYNDENNDAAIYGIDEIEPKLDGWEIVLSDGIATTTQATTNGCYTFAGLNDGDYTITETLSGGWVQNYPVLGYYQITISNHGNIENVDFANFLPSPVIATSTISGYKFNDLNNNGIIDDGGAVVSGWEMQLIKCGSYAPLSVGELMFFDKNVISTSSASLPGACNIISTTTTNSLGYYEFNDLLSGDYGVSEADYCSWSQTFPINNKFYFFKLDDATTTINFANNLSSIEPRTNFISGYKFEDQDGTTSTDEYLLNLGVNWVINLFDNQGGTTPIATTTTDISGYYEFLNLVNGIYYLSEALKPGWIQLIYPLSSVVIDQNDSVDNNFVNYFPICGNGVNDLGEQCDDGNVVNNDGCSSNCINENSNGEDNYCGDGVIGLGEVCDDGNNNGGDGCSAICTKESSGGGGSYLKYTNQGGGITSENEIEEVLVLGEEGAPILKIIKTVAKNFANPGDKEIKYAINITNTGNLTAYSVSVVDTLPDGLNFQDATSKTKTWEIGDLDPGQSKDIKYLVDVDKNAAAKIYSNSAIVSALNHDDVSVTADLEVRKIEVLAETGFDVNELAILIMFFVSSLSISIIWRLKMKNCRTFC